MLEELLSFKISLLTGRTGPVVARPTADQEVRGSTGLT